LVVPDGPATVLDGVIHDGYLWVKYPGNRNKFEVHLSLAAEAARLAAADGQTHAIAVKGAARFPLREAV